MFVSCRIVVIAAVAFAANVSAVEAATVARFADAIVYDGATDRPSDLLIGASPGHLVFDERADVLKPKAGCVHDGGRKVTCDATGVSILLVTLSSRADFARVAAGVPVRVFMRGGPGRDVLTGGDQDDDVGGGAGRDVVDGGAGNDVVRGGPGNDRVSGSRGDDLLLGGGDDDDMQSLDGGADTVDCGRGDDSANAGDSDRFISACDEVRVTNFRSTGCNPGHATTDVKPNFPKRPLRSLFVKVTGANRKYVPVHIDIYRSDGGHAAETPRVRTDGKWHLVRKVSTSYTWSHPTPRCPI